MIKLHHGDCLEIMSDMEDNSIDLVLTDPPYGTTACKWDSVIPFESMWEQLDRICKPKKVIVLFATQPFTSLLISSNINDFKYCWVWDKVKSIGHLVVNHRPMGRVEDICVFGGSTYYPIREKRVNPSMIREYARSELIGQAGVETGYSVLSEYKFPNNVLVYSNASHKGRLHPTQKPTKLLEYLIKTYTKEGETVLDFTMGSGSTGLACTNTRRKFVGIEKDDKYFKIAEDRLKLSRMFT